MSDECFILWLNDGCCVECIPHMVSHLTVEVRTVHRVVPLSCLETRTPCSLPNSLIHNVAQWSPQTISAYRADIPSTVKAYRSMCLHRFERGYLCKLVRVHAYLVRENHSYFIFYFTYECRMRTRRSVHHNHILCIHYNTC